MNKLSIALVNVTNKENKTAMNKDLNGSFGTSDDYGNSFSSKLIKFLKRKSIKLPVITFAYLQAIFRKKQHYVEYFEKTLPKKNFNLILIHGTIVDYKNENRVCKILKKRFPDAKVGFFGPFPSVRPSLFESDFVIIGEPEHFFMNEFEDLKQLEGKIKVSSLTDLNKLPSPNFNGFPIKDYSYFPAITKKPFLVLQASKGCPYDCRFYCAYGQTQGPKVRQRSPEKVVQDIIYLKEKYNVRGIQFRDPTFGISKQFVEDFCKELKRKKVKISWGMETRLDLLNKDIIKLMSDVGLENINIGIETIDPIIAKKNKRQLINLKHQEEIIQFCEDIDVNVSAFYILGYEGDTKRTVNYTIDYAIKLNTPLARFAISTPYPGTGFYEELNKKNRILTKKYETYNQFNLVYLHENFTPEELKKLLEKAYRKYYFRYSYIHKFLKTKFRSLIE